MQYVFGKQPQRRSCSALMFFFCCLQTRMEPGPGDQVGAKRPAENPLPSAPVDVKHARPSPDLPTVPAPSLPPMALASTSVTTTPAISSVGPVGSVAASNPSPRLFPSPVQPQLPLAPPQAAQAGHPPTTAPSPASVSSVLNSGLQASLTAPLHPILVNPLPSPAQPIPPMQSSLSLATHAPPPPIHPPPPSAPPKPPGPVPPPTIVAPAPPSHPIPHIPQQPQLPGASSLAVKGLAAAGPPHGVPSHGGHVSAPVHHPQVRAQSSERFGDRPPALYRRLLCLTAQQRAWRGLARLPASPAPPHPPTRRPQGARRIAAALPAGGAPPQAP